MKKTTLLVLFFITLIQTASGQKPELIVQTGHSSDVRSMSVSSDGKMLLTGGADGTVKLWDLATRTELRTFTNGNENPFGSVLFLPGDRKFLTAATDGTIDFWDLINGKKLNSLKYRSSRVLNVVVMSSDASIIACLEDNTPVITIIGLDDGREIKTFSVSAGFAASIAFSPDGSKLATGGGGRVGERAGGITELWDTKTWKKIGELPRQRDNAWAVAWSPDGRILASGSWDRTIKLWDVEKKKEITTLFGHQGRIMSLNFSPDGSTLASAADDQTVRLWRMQSGVEPETLLKRDNSLDLVVFSPDGRTLIINEDDSKAIILTDWKTKQLIGYLTGHTDEIAMPGIIFSPDGKTMTSTTENIIKLWDIGGGKDPRSLRGHSEYVFEVAFSPDGTTLASGSADKTIKLWDVRTGRMLKTFTGSNSTIYSLAFSPDGKILASGGDNVVKLWNIASGKEMKTLEGPVWNINSVAFSPDGKTLASGGFDKTIWLWDVETGESLRVLLGYNRPVSVVKFSKDGTTLFARGSATDPIRSWDTGSGNEIRSYDWNDLETNETVEGLSDFYQVYFRKLTPDGRFRIRKNDNGQIGIHEKSSDKLLLSLIAVDENDWLALTPDGFFDGTLNAWTHLSWRFNSNTFDHDSLETYFNDFFYPNLLQDVLAGKPPKSKSNQDLQRIDRRQPEVEIASIDGETLKPGVNPLANRPASDKKSIAIIVEVTDNNSEKKQPFHAETSGAQDLRLFRNGSLVKVWHGDVFGLDKTDGCEEIVTGPGEPRRARCRADIRIIADENKLTAYAFNKSNVKSTDSSFSFDGSELLKRDGTLYILAIGVNKYSNPAYDLKFAVPDVVDISAAIRRQQDKLALNPKLAQYSRTEIINLTDGTASKKNILLALRRFSDGDKASPTGGLSIQLKSELSKIKAIQPEDGLIIYYAGHGTSKGPRFYLLPHNFSGSGIDPLKEAVSDVDLGAALEKVDAGHLLMVIDACQSGQALGQKDEGRAPMNSKGLAQLAYDKGMLILTAAQSQQAALEAVTVGGEKIQHGLLTYALLKGLNDLAADADRNGQVWEREWLNYAAEEVPRLQFEAMSERQIEIQKKGRGAGVYYVPGDISKDPGSRKLQTPRIFYRREPETNPFILAR